MGGEEEPARPARWIGDRPAGLGADASDHRADQGAGREVLARPGFGVLGVPFQEPLVDIALHVRAEHHPVGAVDHGDQAEELGRIRDLVLRLGEHLAQHAFLLAESAEKRDVVGFEFRASLRVVRLAQSKPFGMPMSRLYGGFPYSFAILRKIR